MPKKTYSFSKKNARPRRYRNYKKRYNKSLPVNKLPRMELRPELKYNGLTYSELNATSSGFQQLLNGIDQGTDNTKRIGNIIKMHTIEINLTFSTSVASTVKISVVYDKQTNGSTFSLSDYLLNITGVFPPWCLRNLQNRNRFVTLKSYEIDLAPNVSGQAIQKSIKKFFKIPKGVAGVYTGSGDTVASISSGAVYLVITGSSPNSGTTPTFYGSTRVKFTDD